MYHGYIITFLVQCRLWWRTWGSSDFLIERFPSNIYTDIKGINASKATKHCERVKQTSANEIKSEKERKAARIKWHAHTHTHTSSKQWSKIVFDFRFPSFGFLRRSTFDLPSTIYIHWNGGTSRFFFALSSICWNEKVNILLRLEFACK